jgi:hypothetical protein
MIFEDEKVIKTISSIYLYYDFIDGKFHVSLVLLFFIYNKVIE